MSADAAAKLAALAELGQLLGQTLDLDARISRTLTCLSTRLGFAHAMLLVPADTPGSLVMLASQGYAPGVGAQVKLGEGVIGICAERRRSIRINGVKRAIGMVHAARLPSQGEAEISLPGLPGVESQLACPVLFDDELVGVLYVEDERQGRFDVDDSNALQVIASVLAPALARGVDEEAALADPGPACAEPSQSPLRVRYYAADGSVFFDDEYVIKSLPGRLLFKLLTAKRDQGRDEFSKKELRLDPALQLPAVRDNLDTRLILLRRRLAERFPCVQLEPVGRGRFKLLIARPFELVAVTANYP
ncbi:MAG TPA: GAF domain-containing protein [Polyangiaceae bacterium]|nr:GAF domain-containing protein [Polyangiaceae bacterium]